MAVQSGTYRGVSAAQRTAQRRARLLEATLAVWGDSGDTRVTMTRVCAQAGLTERYFYESFTGLDDALTAVMDSIAEEIEQASLAASDAAGPDPTMRVRASIRAFVELLVADPRKGRVAIVEAGAMASLRARRTALLRHFAHRAAQEARELYPTDELGDRDIRALDMAGLLFVGGVAELVTAWLDGTLDADPDDLVEAAARMFLTLHR